MATGGVPTAATTTGTLDIDKDGPVVKQLLKPLNRDELKQLFEELGLSDTTLRNKYELDNVVYADDLIHAWMLGKDRVLEMGGVTKENMIIALKKIGQNGRAANFSTADRFDQGQEQQPQKSAMVLSFDQLTPIMRGATNVNITYNNISTYDPSHMDYEKEAKSQLAEDTTETDSGVAPEQNTSGISQLDDLSSCAEQQMPGVQELVSRRQSTPTPTSHLPMEECHSHEEENDSLAVDVSHMHHDNPDDEKSSSTSESSLSKQESQSDDKNEMVLKETKAPVSTLSQRLQSLALDATETEKRYQEQLQQKDDEIYQKDDKIRQLEEKKDDTDKRYQKEIQSLNEEKTKDKSELDKLRSQIAELEKKFLEKDNLQDRTYPHSNDLCKEIEELRKQLKQERNKVKQKENEIIQLELKLKTTELELEKADNRYKDELRDVAAERDAIKVEHAQLKEKIAEEKQRNAEQSQRKAEEENEKLKEELQRLKEKLLHQNKT